MTTSASTGAEGFYEHDGKLQTWKVKALSRTYLMLTQGVPKVMNFSSDTGILTGLITVNTSIEEPSVIYTNEEYWYPDGKDVKITVDGKELTEEQILIDDSQPTYYKFLVMDKTLDGKDVEIKCSPKQLDDLIIA